MEASETILRNHCVSYRSAYLSFDVGKRAKAIEEPLADITSQLQAWMESRQGLRPGKLGRISGMKRCSRFFIITDESAANMVKKIMSLHDSSLRKDTVGLVFLQENLTTVTPHQGQQNDDLFDTTFFKDKNAVLQSRTWIVGFDPDANSTERNSESFMEKLPSLAQVQMGLGDYVKAEEGLRKLLGEITSAGLDDKGKEIVLDIQRETTYRHAVALSRLERHVEVLEALSMVDFDQSSDQAETTLILQAKVYRLRALSGAYLGFRPFSRFQTDLAEADHLCKRLSDVSTPDVEKPQRVDMFKYRRMEISNSLSESRVIMLQGDYRGALEVLQPALREAILKIGETDVLTLEATLLNCHLQILVGQTRLGRQSCERCLDVIVDVLGPEHNLALEAEYLLIAAAQAEGLLTLALDDSLALCHRVKSRTDFGAKHPSALRYRIQLGNLQLQHGNYLEAESTLESVLVDSAEAWSPKYHPNALRIHSQLALTQYHLGKLDMAEGNISTALRGQLQTYLRIEKGDLWQRDECAGKFLEKTPTLLHTVEGFYRPLETGSKLGDAMPHPDVLVSLLTLGKVLSRKQQPNLNLVLEIFWLVFLSAEKQLGPSHELSLAASIAMGEVFSGKARMVSDDAQQQRKYSLKAASYYNFAVCPGSSIDSPDIFPHTWEGGHGVAESSPIMQQLENYHPTVLHARQEFLVVSILACGGVMDDIKYVQGCKKELEFILAAQQSRLGWNHPHRLRTLFSLLALQVGLDEPKDKVLKTLEELMGRLTRDDIRRQRFLESLLMEQKAAGVLHSRSDLRKRCRAIAEDIMEVVSDHKAIDPSLGGALEMVKDRSRGMLRRLVAY
ncbi:hypothetical protein CEP53_006246 [Fusarium sp. AF-6]|nr:hypothetical protein CEP53_006246 [Fusarium sp. AF-6]